MQTPRKSLSSLVVACALASGAFALLTACQQQRESVAQQEMDWASAAFARNPNLEVVAADAQTGVLTVRDRRTGVVLAVKLDEVAAAPVALLAASAPAPVGESEAAASGEWDAAGTAEPEESPASDASAVAADSEMAPETSMTPPPDYTIERADGRVKVSGPGVSSVSPVAPPASAKGAPGQSTVDPIICEGERMMHFDGRDIYVDGDAITVRGGCELYITNSRIVASATGVVVRGGTVHISNSYVEGGAASFDAERDAKLYLRGSTFQGTSRRDTFAMIEDQGGNRGLPTL